MGIQNKDLGMLLAFQTTIFPYFENMPAAAGFQPWPSRTLELSLEVLLVPLPMDTQGGAAGQLPVRPSRNPGLRPEWPSHSFSIYMHVYTFTSTNKHALSGVES